MSLILTTIDDRLFLDHGSMLSVIYGSPERRLKGIEVNVYMSCTQNTEGLFGLHQIT